MLDLTQTVALCIAVTVSIWGFCYTCKWQKNMALLAFLEQYILDLRMDDAFEIIRNGKDYGKLDRHELVIVKHMLNKFEILAIGLANGIYDRKIIVSTLGLELKRTYKKVKPYIDHIRKDDADGDDESYAEFQKLAESVIKNMSIPKGAKRS